ncbi:MAG TPA: polysaccharide biosynthesis tyrosine autokinase [Solirubrobacteraceae bacterium]|jgi:receptor protein-tyrosine kinase|nr:polysaccharide biosynthesis tyrosine autokinase [Solirubrobacteraceae bacterium]
MAAEPYVPSRAATLRRGLAVVRRRLLTIAAAVVLVPAIAYAVSKAQDPVYEGRATVLATFKDPAAGVTEDDTFNRDDAQRFAATQAGIARTPALADRVARSLGGGATGGDVLDDSAVAPRTGTDLIDFALRDGDRGRALRGAEAYAREFVAYRGELERQALDRAADELRARLRELEARGLRDSSVYRELAERRRRVRTQAALPDASVQFVSREDEATTVSPRTARNVALGLALGLLLGLALAFLREALDTRVRSGDEVVDALGLPVLGRVPKPGRRRRGRRSGRGGAGRPVVLEAPEGREAEAFRKIRTNLSFAALDEPFRTVQVVSATAGEGKTTTAANLAAALARGGQRVVLVDLDLRQPALGAAFGLSGAGIADVLAGDGRVEDALVEVPVDGGSLEVLAAGSAARGGSELLASAPVRDALEPLAERADVVVVDGPPWVESGDGPALSAHVDALLVVVRLGEARRDEVAELRKALAASPARKIGVVLTGIESEDGSGYAYGHVTAGRALSAGRP